MAKQIENLTCTRNGGSMVNVSWEAGDARFHVWLDVDANGPVRPFRVRRDNPSSMTGRFGCILYKNSIAGMREPGFFPTRKLDATSRTHEATVATALAEAERLGLYEQGIAAKDAEKAALELTLIARRSNAIRAEAFKEVEALRADGLIFAADSLQAWANVIPAKEAARLFSRIRTVDITSADLA